MGANLELLVFLGYSHMGVSKNSGTPKSSILIGFSIINCPFWGTPIFGNTHINTTQQNKYENYLTGGGTSNTFFFFTPKPWGRKNPIFDDILFFKGGWFNQQPDEVVTCTLSIRQPLKSLLRTPKHPVASYRFIHPSRVQ